MRLRTRLAIAVIAATSLLVLALFAVIYFVVGRTVYGHLDGDLGSETLEVLHGIVILSDEMIFANQGEWAEREHGQVEINPVFVQVADTAGTILRQTPNLRGSPLPVERGRNVPSYTTTQFGGSIVRICQTPIVNPRGIPLGYLIVAVPAKEVENILANLRLVLIAAFPVALMLLFAITRYVVGKGIAPIEEMTAAAGQITSRNIESRVPLPPHDDEVRRLAVTINELLGRLQEAIVRELQFIADASHELRTPLASLRGTLDVLLRRPRTVAHYQEKIRFSLNEAERLSALSDQLLHLARCESGSATPSLTSFELKELVQRVVAQAGTHNPSDKRPTAIRANGPTWVNADRSFTEVILTNVLSNARKYSPQGSPLEIHMAGDDGKVRCIITDQGRGIAPEHLPHIFDRFFRGDSSRSSAVEGTGLGLTIVKRLADLQHLRVEVLSTPGKGTSFVLIFPAAEVPPTNRD